MDSATIEPAGECHIDLSRVEIAVIVDALLRAELSLSLIDNRHSSIGEVASIRAMQFDLADKLEGHLHRSEANGEALY